MAPLFLGEAAAFVATTSLGIDGREVGFGLRTVRIAARNEMRGFITVRRPDQKHSPTPQTETLEAKLAIPRAGVFHHDHGIVEDEFKICEIDLVFPEVLATLRPAAFAGRSCTTFVPHTLRRVHAETVALLEVRYEPNEFWMLALYAKAKQDNVPAHILRQLLEVFRNG